MTAEPGVEAPLRTDRERADSVPSEKKRGMTVMRKKTTGPRAKGGKKRKLENRNKTSERLMDWVHEPSSGLDNDDDDDDQGTGRSCNHQRCTSVPTKQTAQFKQECFDKERKTRTHRQLDSLCCRLVARILEQDQ